MPHQNPAANAINAFQSSTNFRQQQNDRRRDLSDRESKANIAGLLGQRSSNALTAQPQGQTPTQPQGQAFTQQPNNRQQAVDIAQQSGNADIINQTRQRIAGMDQAQRVQALERSEALGGLSIQLQNMPYEQRIQALRSPQIRDFLIGSGFSEEQINSFDPTDVNIQAQMGTVAGVQEALTTGFEAVTLGEQQSRVQRNQAPIVNPNAAPQRRIAQQGADTARITAEAQRTTAGARRLGAQTAARAETREAQKARSGDDRIFNQNQTNAATFASRMREADKIISELAEDGFLGSELRRGNIPLIGAAISGQVERQFEQAKENFVSAALRKESGAAINDQERESAAKLYFPVFGDGEDVIANKRSLRSQAVRLMISSSQGALEAFEGAQQNQGGEPSLTTEEQAELEQLERQFGGQ
ncbi:MAG: hypothetical protein JKY52_08595 [Flavobacteriales bacterium]|nr:hypothetical protein [Flavobacteriales bacterium]